MQTVNDTDTRTYSDCGFEICKDYATIPKRATQYSAGYDLSVMETHMMKPGEIYKFHTGVKSHIPPNMYLQITIRSGVAIKRGLVLVNQVGVIDADYHDEILLYVKNTGKEEQYIKRGDRLANGIFLQYYRVPGDNITATRDGGFGSTGD